MYNVKENKCGQQRDCNRERRLDDAVINRIIDMSLEKHSLNTPETVFEQSQAVSFVNSSFIAIMVPCCHGFPQMKSITARLKKGQWMM